MNATLEAREVVELGENYVSIPCPEGTFWDGIPLFFYHGADASHNDSIRPVKREELPDLTQRVLQALDHFHGMDDIVRVVGPDIKLLYTPGSKLCKSDLMMILPQAVADAQMG